jgi:2-amino-4-hydroxy-6-hydroxymethyldihydropteridine diphosphokinase
MEGSRPRVEGAGGVGEAGHRAAERGTAHPKRIEEPVLRAFWRPAYVAIGSNLNQPRERVAEASAYLAALSDTRLVARSPLYRTHPMGPQDQPDYVNAAAGLLTRKSPHDTLDALLDIERRMGRIRGQRWGPRVIDLDLVWMVGTGVDDPGLTLPHPGVSRRNFVLYPLSDIAPTLDIPGHGRVLDLKRELGGDGISLLE